MIIAESVVNMRKTPSAVAEVVSQGLMGESVSVLSTNDHWSEIVMEDQYSGWVPSFTLVDVSYTPNLTTCRNAVPVYGERGIQKGPVNLLPYGVNVEAKEGDSWDEVTLPSGEQGYIQKGNLFQKKKKTKEELGPFAKEFLGLPYIWGGRSSFGYDCSGFIQMLFKEMERNLPRDARLQIKDPHFSEKEEPEAGDLIFWGASREKIEHVGLYLGSEGFIHATNQEGMPWLRISQLKDSNWDPKTSTRYPFRIFGSL